MKLNKAAILFFMGAIGMLNLFGCSEGPKYGQYSSRDPELGVTMQYPKDWSYSEARGANGSYAQVVFIEPKKKDKPVLAQIVLTVRHESKAGVKPPTQEAMKEDLLKKRLKFKDALVLSQSISEISGIKCDVLEFSYSLRKELYSLDGALVPIREKVIIFKNGEKFYIFRYRNTKQDFEKFNKAFVNCAGTLRFKI
ncbi:MAG TPA: hypothetical protein DCL35_01740 [Candidatus Omnitrophica bacterium]|nr:hypothetical protein [Candidatus Omnitrophota bacterium]